MLLVRDIMATNVEVVTPDLTVRELARFLARRGISGAPVVDGSDQVVGVVSTTDLARLTGQEPVHPGPSVSDTALFPPEEVQSSGGEDESWYWFLASEAPSLYAGGLIAGMGDLAEEMTVAEIMTPVAFDVRPDAKVTELAEFLRRGKIHRALVMEDGELVGIVTTFDVLRAVTESPELTGS